MTRTFQRIIATILLLINCTQLFAAALPSYASKQTTLQSIPYSQFGSPTDEGIAPLMDSFTIATNQLGLSGPLSVWATYSNLTGLFFTGQYLKKLADTVAVGILGEYGSKQYRVNGTIGFNLEQNSLLKITAEHFSQKLPFVFDTGNLDKRVGQNAFGARFQKNFDNRFFNNLNMGGYYAHAENIALAPINFISNGTNCLGADAGLICVNERNIAGATSAGADVGTGLFLTPITALEGNVYYDRVNYNTIFSSNSNYNDQGFGWGLSGAQLIQPNLKFSAGAEVRKIYDTYNVSVAWLPPFTTASGSELALILQRVISHNPTPDNDTVGLKFTFLTDKTNYEEKIYRLQNKQQVSDIGNWVQAPAVRMNQVLAIAEQYTHLLAPTVTQLSPNNGPLMGGNVVIITGSNFPSNILVKFNNQVATVTSVTPTSISVVVPASSVAGVVDVSLTTPDGQIITLSQAYAYSNNGTGPQIFSLFPNIGNVAGLSGVTITGTGFIPGDTLVEYFGANGLIRGAGPSENMLITPTSVTPTKIIFDAPPHEPGPVNVRVITSKGSSAIFPSGFTYITSPTVTTLVPNSGPLAGSANVRLNGSGFVVDNTVVNFNGLPITPNLVTANYLLFNVPQSNTLATVDVSVSTPAGTSINVNNGYTYTSPPTVSNISPASGSVQGVTGVQITGTNFTQGAKVVIDGVEVSATVNNSMQLTFDAPRHDIPGVVAVFVRTAAGDSAPVPGGFNYTTAPAISTITPNSALTNTNQTMVTISGSGFINGETTVYFDNEAITPQTVTTQQIEFYAPLHANPGTVDVKVQTSTATSATLTDGFTYVSAAAVPTATSLNPNQGSTNGIDMVILNGTNFVAGATQVNIGTATVDAIVSSPTSLTFAAPQLAAGNVNVSVTTIAGTSGFVPGGFTYVSPPSVSSIMPRTGPLNTPISVTATGQNFTADTVVNINGVPATITNIANIPTSITFTVPASASANTVSITITTPGGTASVNGGFSYLTAPTIISVMPTTVPNSGYSGVKLSGTNFDVTNTVVAIDGVDVPASSITNITPQEITFNTGNHANGSVDVRVTTPGGTATLSNGLTFADAPTISGVAPSYVSLSGQLDVIITGSGFIQGSTSVTLDGVLLNTTVNSNSQLQVNIPSRTTAGTGSLVVQTNAGTSAPATITYVGAVPTATSLSITSSNTAGVNGVVIQGTNFIANNTTVTIGGNTVTPYNVSATSLTFDAPGVTTAGAVNVTVSTAGGSSNSLVFTYTDNPTLIRISPASGGLAGTPGVELSGTGFINGSTTLYVGGVVTATTSVTADTIVFDMPLTSSAGTVSISVDVAGNSATLAGGFTYTNAPTVASITPDTVAVSGGELITVKGANYITGTEVRVDGLLQAITINNPGELTFTAPQHAAGVASVQISNSGGNTTAVLNYVDSPTIGNIAPTVISTAGGTISVSGSGFINGNMTVTVDGVVVTPYNISSSSMMIDLGTHNPGQVAVVVTTPGGTANGSLTFSAPPTLSTINPVAGAANASTSIQLSGLNFTADALVNVGSNSITPSSITSTTITFNSPALQAGTVNVSVTTGAGTSGNLQFTYADVPTISSINPVSSPTSGSTNILLNGANFITGLTTVYVDGSPVNTYSVGSTTLRFDAPIHVQGNVSVTVVTPGGTSSPLAGGLIYIDAPTVSGVSPNAVSIGGATGVGITGTNFVPGYTSVILDGVSLPAQVSSSGALTFDAPQHSVGTVSISVTTPSGTSGNVASGFTYADTPTGTLLNPTVASVNGGTRVTLTGSNFIAGNTVVKVDGIDATLISVAPTSVVFEAPGHAAGTANVVLYTPGGNTGNIASGLTYTVAPNVSAVNPGAVSLSGRAAVTITGEGFVNGQTTVNLGNASLSAQVSSPTLLTFDAPQSNVAGTVTISVTTPLGTSSNYAPGFTYAATPVLSSIAPNIIPTSGYVDIIVTGSNFTPTNSMINLGGTLIAAQYNSPTSLTFTAPDNSAGSLSVNVETPGGISNVLVNGLTYVNSPTVGTLTPNSGSTNGVNDVVLTGNNFLAGNTTILYDNVPISTTVTVESATRLRFNAPMHNAGTVSVKVQTPGGTSAAVTNGFTYRATPNITSCSYPGGALSTLFLCVGTNMNAFPNTFINVQGGLTCTASLLISPLTTTLKNALNLGGNSILPSLYAGCNIKLCNNAFCTDLQSNAVLFS